MPIPAGSLVDDELPDWAPTLAQVADHCPGRTLSQDLTGAVLTFTPQTRPTDDEVNRLIVEAVSWVEVKTGPAIAESLEEFASSTAAVYTAAMVERGYPRNSDDLNTAGALYDQAVDMRNDLKTANEATTGQDPVDPAASVQPVFAFPRPDEWLDDSTFF